MFPWALIFFIVGVATQAKASRDNKTLHHLPVLTVRTYQYNPDVEEAGAEDNEPTSASHNRYPPGMEQGAGLWRVANETFSEGSLLQASGKNPVLHNETFIQPKYQPFLTTCQGYRACSKYRTVYTVSVRQVKKELLRVRTVCCPGWRKKEPTSEDCEEALCHKPCQNGGTCVKPNMCRCPAGWGGRYCHVDIDECRRPSQPCPQLCINTRGSFLCECRPGFTLGEDGKSCTRNKELSQLPAQQAEDASHRLSNEIQDLRNLVESLEQRLDSTLSAVQRLFPMKLSEIRSDQVHEFWERIQSLDRMDSFSDQLMFMEEKMGECSCRSNEIEMAVNLKR